MVSLIYLQAIYLIWSWSLCVFFPQEMFEAFYSLSEERILVFLCGGHFLILYCMLVYMYFLCIGALGRLLIHYYFWIYLNTVTYWYIPTIEEVLYHFEMSLLQGYCIYRLPPMQWHHLEMITSHVSGDALLFRQKLYDLRFAPKTEYCPPGCPQCDGWCHDIRDGTSSFRGSSPKMCDIISSLLGRHQELPTGQVRWPGYPMMYTSNKLHPFAWLIWTPTRW